MSEGIRCMWMRGGTSKGAFFLAEDIPTDPAERDRVLLGVMGSPDDRQIDGMGGADPLTSKVAVVKRSTRPGIDLDYLFLQVSVDQALVSDRQNCGNMLAAVGPFALERGLVDAEEDVTRLRVYMENSDQTATVEIRTPNRRVAYAGEAAIDGVPGTASPVLITFEDTAGANCGALLPTGNARDTLDGIAVTCIDNGMPTVMLRASDFGLTGRESRADLDANDALKRQVESIRLQAGPLMNLGDVTEQTVPKMSLIAAPTFPEGALSTRTFIPHRCHASIGVLGAVSVATACAIEGTVAWDLAKLPSSPSAPVNIEHPTGQMSVVLKRDRTDTVTAAAILRTARKLFDGRVFPAEPTTPASTAEENIA